MSRDHAVISAKDTLLWFLVGLNVIVLLTAIFTGSDWLWALSVTNSLAILVRYSQKRRRRSDDGPGEQPPARPKENNSQFQSENNN